VDRGDAAHAVDRGAVAVRGRCARRALLSHHARADARPGPDLGQTFEREAIEDWLKTHKTDPVTGEKLPASIVFCDHVMGRAPVHPISSS